MSLCLFELKIHLSVIFSPQYYKPSCVNAWLSRVKSISVTTKCILVQGGVEYLCEAQYYYSPPTYMLIWMKASVQMQYSNRVQWSIIKEWMHSHPTIILCQIRPYCLNWSWGMKSYEEGRKKKRAILETWHTPLPSHPFTHTKQDKKTKAFSGVVREAVGAVSAHESPSLPLSATPWCTPDRDIKWWSKQWPYKSKWALQTWIYVTEHACMFHLY